MAVSVSPVSNSLVIVSNAGKTAAGKAITKKVTLKYVATSAANQDVYDVATAIGNILNYTVSEIDIVNHSMLINA